MNYGSLGIHAARRARGRVRVGGSLLAMTAAALGRQKSKGLKTPTLLEAQPDFTEPGELSLFVDQSQLAWLDGLMAQRSMGADAGAGRVVLAAR